MKRRYWSASASTEILARSTFWVRASASSTSSGPSKPSRLTTRASCVPTASSAASHASKPASDHRGSGSGGSAALVLASAMRFPRCGKPVNHLRADYTDSGDSAQNLGKPGLRLGHLEGLLSPQIRHGRARSGPAQRLAARARPRPRPRSRRGRRCTPAPHREPAASTAPARSATVPDSAFMPRSSLMSKPAKPMAPRIASSRDALGDAGRRLRIEGREHDVGRHRRRQAG